MNILKKELTKESLLSGIDKTFNNAKSLMVEAQLLFANEYYPRAYSLLQLSTEELGKVFLLIDALFTMLCDKDIDFISFINKYEDHKEKIKISNKLGIIFVNYLKETNQEYQTLEKYLNSEKNSVFNLNEMKKKGLYVCFMDNIFHSPYELINKSDVHILYQKAQRDYSILEILFNNTKANLGAVVEEYKKIED